jgi:hypothetical protein
MNPAMTIDIENGMLICACGTEANENGYCDDCVPLRIVVDDIAESKPLRPKVVPIDEDDIPLAVLARKFKEKRLALERNDDVRAELFTLLSSM